jgi:hypothetical protein
MRVAGTTRNLSAHGVCVEIDRPVPEGTAVALRLYLVEDDVEAERARGLDLEATVQWTAESDRGHAVGLKFVKMTDEQSRALANAVRATAAPA